MGEDHETVFWNHPDVQDFINDPTQWRKKLGDEGPVQFSADDLSDIRGAAALDEINGGDLRSLIVLFSNEIERLRARPEL